MIPFQILSGPFRSSTRASFAAHHDVPAVVQGHGLVARHCTVLVYLEPLFLIIRDPSAYGYRKELCTHVQPSGNNPLHNPLTDKGRIYVRAQGDLDINSISIPPDSRARWKDLSFKVHSLSRLSFSKRLSFFSFTRPLLRFIKHSFLSFFFG